MKRLWMAFAAVMIVSFLILGWIGTRIFQEMPPIPDKFVTTTGATLIDSGEVGEGQNVWQSLGGMQVGSIWGHGSYVAPDWTADWLHREAVFILDKWANDEFSKPFADLDSERQAQLSGRLSDLMRNNTYDESTGSLPSTPFAPKPLRPMSITTGPSSSTATQTTRFRPDAISSEERLRKFSSFVFWTSWAASTTRPGDIASYTNNWPHEPLVGNRPTGDNIVWTGVSVIMLLAGISGMAWWYASRREEEEKPDSIAATIRWRGGKRHRRKRQPSSISGSSRH